MVSNTQNNDYSAYNGNNGPTSNHGMYEEPIVDVLRNSHRAQLAEALGQSGNKQHPVDNMMDIGYGGGYGSGETDGAITPDGLLARKED